MASRLLLAFTVPFLLAAAQPETAHPASGPDELFWFVAATDIHIGENLWGGLQDTENLNWLTDELVKVVKPRFIVATGDLVDATAGGLIPLGQNEAEWQNYQAILTANGMAADFYRDLPGNHDQYSDKGLSFYMKYSVSGPVTQSPNQAWTVEVPGSKYLFLGLATCGSDGLPWPFETPGLDDADLQFVDDALAANADANIIVAFGHHPIGEYDNGKGALHSLIGDWAFSAYIHGHKHDHVMFWNNDALNFREASLGKSGDKQVGLFAFDGRAFSARAFDAQEWPMLLVTAPADAGLGGNNPYDYMVPTWMTQAPVRALAFHPGGVASVTAALDDVAEIPLLMVQDGVWQASFDASGLDLYPHTLKVTATAQDQSTDEQQVTFYVFDDPDPPEEPEPEVVEVVEAVEVVEPAELPEAVEVIEPVEAAELDGEGLDAAGADAADDQAPDLEVVPQPEMLDAVVVPDSNEALPLEAASPEAAELRALPDSAGQDDAAPAEVETAAETLDLSGDGSDLAADNLPTDRGSGCAAGSQPAPSHAGGLALLLLLALSLAAGPRRVR